MATAHWSGAETARRLGVSEASISAYINGTQVPPDAKIKLLRLTVDHFLNNNSESEQHSAPAAKPDPGLDPPPAPPAAAAKKSLREIRLEALLSRIESLAGGLRFFQETEERVEAAEELSALASELAKQLQTPHPPKTKASD